VSEAIESFQEQIPDSLKFSLGYIDGRHQMSLVNCDDLHAMYSKHKFGVSGVMVDIKKLMAYFSETRGFRITEATR